MGGVSSQDGHGRRARRDGPVARTPVGPLLGWVVFALAVAAVVLLLVGVAVATVLALVAAGGVVGGVLLAAVRFSPPPVGEQDAARPDGGSS